MYNLEEDKLNSQMSLLFLPRVGERTSSWQREVGVGIKGSKDILDLYSYSWQHLKKKLKSQAFSSVFLVHIILQAKSKFLLHTEGFATLSVLQL